VLTHIARKCRIPVVYFRHDSFLGNEGDVTVAGVECENEAQSFATRTLGAGRSVESQQSVRTRELIEGSSSNHWQCFVFGKLSLARG
jgi:hypothetical protein